MLKLEKIIDDLQFLSDRLSTQVRTIALGLLVLSWGLLIGESKTAIEVSHRMKRELLAVGALAILTMFLDFLQYLFGYLDARSTQKKAEQSVKKEAQYDDARFTYKSRTFLFWAKQALLSANVGLFLYIVGNYLMDS